MRHFLTAALTFCVVLGSSFAEQVLYQEDFSNFQPSANHNQSLVPSGHPDFAQALKLQSTIRAADGKVVQASWGHGGFDTAGLEEVVIDYWIKFENEPARYFMLGNDGNIKSITVIQDGKKLKVARTNFQGWAEGGEVALQEWHKCRYVVNFIRGSFSVYLNDMEVPRLADFSFRDSSAVGLTRIWILGSESDASTTYLGPVKITALPMREFPPLTLAEWPYYVKGVKWTDAKPTAAADFADVAPVWMKADGGAVKEPAQARVMRDADNLYLHFEMQAQEMQLRVDEDTARDGRPWINDCFEIFLQPDVRQPTYYHLVGNSSGGRYDSCHSFGQRDNSWDCDWQAVIGRQQKSWTALVTIPFAGLGGAPKNDTIWGFNVGRENPHTREVLSWTRLSNFHTPDKFGKLFYMASNDPRSLEARTSDLMQRLYDLPTQLATIAEQLKGYRYINQNINALHLRLQTQLQALQAELAVANSFPVYRQLLEKTQSLSQETTRMSLTIQHYQAYFAEGSAAQKRGYASLVMTAMDKVASDQDNVFPLLTEANLRLSGNEYGSFQVLIQMPPEKTFDALKTSITPLRDARRQELAGAKAQIYLVEMMRTAKQLEVGQSQVDYADVLHPGESFNFAPRGLALLWVDVYLPAQAVAGDYSAVLTVTPAGLPPVEIPIKVSSTGLTLPKSASLDTAFCFAPSWVKDFYGVNANDEQRLAYYQFLLDHRLEPMNLWSGGDVDIGKAYLDYCAENGKTMIFLSISNIRNRQKEVQATIDEYRGRLRPIFFGHDEVLMVAGRRPGALERMQKDYADAKELFPDVPRMNTARIDERLFGYVDIWCPLFHHYEEEATKQRQALGEQVWWYPTDYPLAPYANFNLDSPGIDPRVIVWMNWKLNLTGLLYWGLNREWRSNGVLEASHLDQDFCRIRALDWATPAVVERMRAGEIRWPEIPWLPYFRNLNSGLASRTNGGGNLMYPGKNFQPLPSTRLKNLRDGMQDYEYFVMLRRQVDALRERGGQAALVREAEAVLAIDNDIVGSASSYTKSPAALLAYRDKLIDLVLRTR